MNQTSVVADRRQAARTGQQYSQRRPRLGLLLAIVLIAATLSGCGNKGPLKLPDSSTTNEQSA